MISKFREYFKKKNVVEVPKMYMEDLEDQLLRLKEVFLCKIFIPSWSVKTIDKSIYSAIINIGQLYNTSEEEIKKELDQIKNRIKNMYNLNVEWRMDSNDMDLTYYPNYKIIIDKDDIPPEKSKFTNWV